MNVAINGFGRIGRAILKASIEKKANFNVVAINDLTDVNTLAYLLKYDSVYGKFNTKVEAKGHNLIIGNKTIKITAEKDPANLPWAELKVDIVMECTGRFCSKEGAMAHIKAGAKKVIISAPAKGAGVKTVVLGVNEENLKKSDVVISNASCTTNCLAPVTKVIKDAFGIEKAIMTTVHAYTGDQNLVDGPHKDFRRARAAALNMVPTTTGAAIAVTETIPALKDKFDGMAVRVPTPVGSLCDIVYVTKKNVTEEMVNKAIKQASRSAKLKNILEPTDEQIVSSDIVGNPASSIVDLSLTKVVGGNLLKVVSWYDNEWGYSNRMVDLADYIIKKKLL